MQGITSNTNNESNQQHDETTQRNNAKEQSMIATKCKHTHEKK
jgi:hypothetical protein